MKDLSRGWRLSGRAPFPRFILHPSSFILLDLARDLADLEALQGVALGDIVPVADGQTALVAGLHLAHVLLDAPEGVDLAGVEQIPAAEVADLGAAAKQPVGDV